MTDVQVEIVVEMACIVRLTPSAKLDSVGRDRMGGWYFAKEWQTGSALLLRKGQVGRKGSLSLR